MGKTTRRELMQRAKLAHEHEAHVAMVRSLAQKGIHGAQHLCHRLGKTTCGPKPIRVPQHKLLEDGGE
jgi:hypothetical protein